MRLLGDARAGDLDKAITATLESLAKQIAGSEQGILDGATSDRARSLLTGFLRAFAAHVPTRDRLHVFTTNYDRVVEWGAEQSGLRVLDRFVGDAALCRPNAALVTYGYGFGDDHINRVIRDMLTVPSAHLVIIAYGDPTGRIARFHADHNHTGLVSLLYGPTYADLPALVERWLPWPAAEPLARAQIEILRATGAPSSTAPAGTP